MRALVKETAEPYELTLKDVPNPNITDDDQVIIKVEYVGICGTDLHMYSGNYALLKPPIIIGHEFSGIVSEIGKAVTKVKVGDRVTSETTLKTCGVCEFCETKEYNLCPNRSGIGTQVDGAMAEFVLTREESVHVLADIVPLEWAAMSEPYACGVHASMDKTTVKKDDTVLIFGPGTIGLCLAQVVKSTGAKIILAGISHDKEKLELALAMGIHYTINTEEEDLLAFIMKLTDGKGVDKVFECAGVAAVLKDIPKYLRRKGEWIQMGVCKEEENLVRTNDIVQREQTLIGSRSQKPSSWVKTVSMMAEKQLDPAQLITATCSFEEAKDAFDAMRSGKHIKILLTPNKKED